MTQRAQQPSLTTLAAFVFYTLMKTILSLIFSVTTVLTAAANANEPKTRENSAFDIACPVDEEGVVYINTYSFEVAISNQNDKTSLLLETLLISPVSTCDTCYELLLRSPLNRDIVNVALLTDIRLPTMTLQINERAENGTQTPIIKKTACIKNSEFSES